jgi:hypothetical protein
VRATKATRPGRHFRFGDQRRRASGLARHGNEQRAMWCLAIDPVGHLNNRWDGWLGGAP